MTIRTLGAAIADLESQAIATLSAARDMLQAGTQTSRDLLQLQAATTGERADVYDLRQELDGAAVADGLAVATGENTLAIWLWERDTRHHLVALDGSLRRCGEVVDLLVSGRTRKQHIVRSGETLQQIAAVELGDWREWPRLLEANPGVAPGALASGLVLTIPEKR